MGSMIEFTRPDGAKSQGYLAESPAPGAPGLILIQEWWGLKPHILELAQRFADAGYTVLTPDLYRGRIASDADEANHLMGELDFVDACDQDLAGALSYLQTRSPKVGVLGFCMGGALTIAAAARLPGLAAANCFYGIPPAALADPAKIQIPLQGHFASEDDWCTPATVDTFEKALSRQPEFHRYQAQHAFFNNSRPEVYDAACSQLAWERSLDFFRRTLSG